MNSGQTVLVILAMMLLGTLSLSVNRALISSSTTSLEMEASLDALSYGQSMLDEIPNHAFDQKTTGGAKVFNYIDMTRPNRLGPETSLYETISFPDTLKNGLFASDTVYNDVDDYKGYQRRITNPRLGYFNINDSVCYVSENDPDSVNNASATFQKRITVVITCPYLPKDASGKLIPLVMRDLAIYRRYF